MFRKCIFLMTVTLVPVFGYSFDVTKLYVKGFLGPNFISIPSTPKAKLDSNVGYAIGGSLGYEFLSVWSVEGELCYRSNSLDQLTISDEYGKYKFDVDGNSSSFSCICNLVIEFPMNCLFTPYLGGGLGGCKEWGDLTLLKNTSYETRLKAKNEGVIYQLIAGVNLFDFRSIKTNIEYHFVDFLADLHANRNHTLALSCTKKF